MPNLVEINPVVWAPNPNKQTDRQTGLFYMYRLRKMLYIDDLERAVERGRGLGLHFVADRRTAFKNEWIDIDFRQGKFPSLSLPAAKPSGPGAVGVVLVVGVGERRVFCRSCDGPTITISSHTLNFLQGGIRVSRILFLFGMGSRAP